MRKLLITVAAAIFAPVLFGTTLYVSTTGSDYATGESSDSPLRTINKALETLATMGGGGGQILLAPGTYTETPLDTETPTNRIYIASAVTIAGTGASPEDTIIARGDTKQYRMVKLDHPNATLRNLTITGGVIPISWKENLINFGANVWITKNGGNLENCIIKDGICLDYGGAAANVWAEGGTVSHCKLIGGRTNKDSDGLNYKANQQGGSLICRGTCVVDNTLITGCVTNQPRYAAGGGPVYVHDSGKLVNCTITGNKSSYCGGVIVGSANARVINCAIIGNSGNTDDPIYSVCRVHRSNPAATFDPTAIFENCVVDVAVNESCITAVDPDWSAEFVPNPTSPLVDKCQADDIITAIMKEKDLAGAPRLRGAKYDIGCYECQTSPAIVFEKLDATIVDGKARLTIKLAKDSLPIDLKIMATVDGILNAVDAGLFFKGDEKYFEYSDSAFYSIGLFAHSDNYDLVRQLGTAYLGAEQDNVLFVSKSGNDENDGKSFEKAKLTINNAIASLTADGGKVYIAPGTYDTELNSEYDAGSNRVVVARDCTVIGAGASNEDVVLTSAAGKRVLVLDHENACVRNLTVKNGSQSWNSNNSTVVQSCKGANVWIKNGIMENCIIRDGYSDGYNSCAGNLIMNAGRISNCKIIGGTVRGDHNGRNYSYSEGGSVALAGGVMENCLITGCQPKDNKSTGGGPINIYGTATLVNCTITGNDGAWTGGVIVGSATAKAINCAIYGNTLSTDPGIDTDPYYRPTRNTKIENITNATTKVTAYFDHAATSAEGLKDAGAAYTGMSQYDIIGMPRVIGSAVDIGCYEEFAWRRLVRLFSIIIR